MFGLAKYDREVKFVSLILILTYFLSPIIVKLFSPFIGLLPTSLQGVAVNSFAAWMPACVAVAFTFINIGPEGVERLFRQLIPQPRHILLYLFIPAFSVMIVAIATVFVDLDIGLLWHYFYLNWSSFAVLFLMQLCLVAIGEELGWRGYLQSNLLRKCSKRKTAFYVFLAWTIWHWPKFTQLSYTGSLALALSLLAFSFFFVFSRSWFRPYLLIFAIIHGSFNTSIYFFEPVFGEDMVNVWLATSVIYAALTLLIVFYETLKSEQSNQGPTHYSGY